MKRIIIIASLLLLVNSIQAQSIKYRRLLDPNGLSVMTTALEVYPWGATKIEYALQYEVTPVEGTHQGFYLNVYFTTRDKTLYIPAGGKILIRTTQGNVITLADCGAESFIEYNTEYDQYKRIYRSTYRYDSIHGEEFIVQGKYPISEEDLNTLKDEGVIKIRIETTGEAVECTYKDTGKDNNKTAAVLSKLYNVLITNIDPYYGL